MVTFSVIAGVVLADNYILHRTTEVLDSCLNCKKLGLNCGLNEYDGLAIQQDLVKHGIVNWDTQSQLFDLLNNIVGLR